jgi:hypothetical protein
MFPLFFGVIGGSTKAGDGLLRFEEGDPELGNQVATQLLVTNN